MQSIRAFLQSLFRNHLAGAVLGLFVVLAASLSSAHAADLPDDDDQDILVRTTLMRFNDANVTGNYSVLIARGSSQFQKEATQEKLATAFEGFRKKNWFIDNIATADYESREKAKIGDNQVLVLAGVLGDDELTVKYNLSFTWNSDAWKLDGINVDVHRKAADKK